MGLIEVGALEVVYTGTVAPAYACVFASQTFEGEDGTIITKGDPSKMSGNYYRRNAVTRVSGLVTIPAFEDANAIEATVDAATGVSRSNYTLGLYSSTGKLLDIIHQGIQISDDLVGGTTWGALATYSASHRQPQRFEYLDRDQIVRLLNDYYLSTDVDTLLAGYARLTTDQTINGTKTFGTIPVLPAANPTTDNQAARKKYVDDRETSILAALTSGLNGKQDADALLSLIAALSDPGSDKILFWDESANAFGWLEPAANLTITGTDLDAATGGGGSGYFTLLTDYADLAAAITAIGATKTVLVIDKNSTVTTDIVVPATCVLKFVKGFKITLTNPGTLEFEGQGVVQEDLDGSAVLFEVPQPLVWWGNVTAIRNSTTITQDGNNYDAVSARDAGRFIYLPDLNLRTRVASVPNTNEFVLDTAVPLADFAIAPLSGTFTAATDDICTLNDHGFQPGQIVQVSTTGTLPAGLTAATNYYIIRTGRNTFKLATSLVNAQAGTAVNITDTGTGTHTVTANSSVIIDSTDFALNNVKGYFTKRDHGLTLGYKLRLTTTSALPTGYATGTDYWAIPNGPHTFRLASTEKNAYSGTVIAISDVGTGTHTVDATLSGSNDFLGAFAYVYNVGWTGSVFPRNISTRIWNTVDMGSIAYATVPATYIEMGLSGNMNAAGLALAEKKVQIDIYPRTDYGLGLYASIFPYHTAQFHEGRFVNDSISDSIAYFNNTLIRGKGKFSTIIEESSVQGKYVVFVAAASTGQVNRRDRNENVEICDLQILGQPRPQNYRTGSAQSDHTIGAKKVKNFHIHDCFLNGTASLGIFVGEGIRANTTEIYSEDIKIVDNWFYGMATQAVGVTAGSMVEISRNRVRLQGPYDSSATSAIDVEPIGSLSDADGISSVRVNDNHIDVRGTKLGPVTGINFLAGEYQGFRGIQCDNNFIVGKTPGDDASVGVPSPVLDYGIQFNQVHGGSCQNNTIMGAAGPYAIWMVQCGYMTVAHNLFHGIGGNDVIYNQGGSNNYFVDNISYEDINTGSYNSRITETSMTVTVDTNGTALTYIGSPDISYFTASMVNGVIRISGVDYEIQSVTSNTAAVLKSSAGVQSGIVSTIRPVRNKYKDNTVASYVTVDTSAALNSVIYSRFADFRLSGNVTIDPASVAANTVASQTFTLTGARTGDSLILNPPTAGLTAGLLVLQSFVSATDQITVVFHNTTGAPIDEASATWRYTLLR